MFRVDPARPRRQAAARRAARPDHRGARLRAGGRGAARVRRRVRGRRRRSCVPATWSPPRRGCWSPSGSTGTPLSTIIATAPRRSATAAGCLHGHAALLRAGPGRAAARRPAPGQLPAAARRPARRDRLRRGGPAARRAPRADRPADPAGAAPATPTAVVGGPARRGLRQAATRRSTPQAVLDFLRPMLEPIAVDEFRFTRAWLRAEAARLASPKSPATSSAGSSTCRRRTC